MNDECDAQCGKWKLARPSAVPLFARISIRKGVALVSNLSAFLVQTYRSMMRRVMKSGPQRVQLKETFQIRKTEKKNRAP